VIKRSEFLQGAKFVTGGGKQVEQMEEKIF